MDEALDNRIIAETLVKNFTHNEPGFRAVLAEEIEKALNEERERCAVIAEDHDRRHSNTYAACGKDIAAEIRKGKE